MFKCCINRGRFVSVYASIKSDANQQAQAQASVGIKLTSAQAQAQASVGIKLTSAQAQATSERAEGIICY